MGAYADIKSARSVHERDQFKKMIADCLDGKIDIIITKMVSRFGRNTVDTLSILRALKDKGVDVFFENENLHSIDGNDELLIFLMEAIAQSESESRSQNIKWGIKQQAQNPDASIYSRPCYGYRKQNVGTLSIFEGEAETVRPFLARYVAGYSILEIKKEHEADGILSPTGKSNWPKQTIETILANEKYVGDVIIYKTYCTEYPKSTRVRNKCEKERYAIKDHHPAIIDRSTFDGVQTERD